MDIDLRPVTRFNWQTCINLQLPEDQAGRLASNLYSLAEAYVEPELAPRAIYAGDRVIGFAMYFYSSAEHCFWIPRFMVDARYQGRGYGRRAMQVILDTLAAECAEAPVLISFTPDNHAARGLYRSLGFKPTGRHTHGEEILCYRSPGAAGVD